MSLEDEFDETMRSLFQRTGRATGYWPNYFLREVRANGGLSVARKLLAPGTVSQGFGRLVEARRADLSVEAIALSNRYAHLFTTAELATARRRLAQLPKQAWPRRTGATAPEEVPEGVEGAATRVWVNRYERDPKLRSACIKFHGSSCLACGLDFECRYGEIGRGFIHVHHLRPLAGAGAKQRVNPKTDLVPVCPNCHAMLHRREPPMDIEELRHLLSRSG